MIMKQTIKEKVLIKLCKKKKSFSRREILESLALVKGLPKETYHKRCGYYGVAIQSWVADKLLKKISKGIYKTTNLCKIFINDKNKYKMICLKNDLKRHKSIINKRYEKEKEIQYKRFSIPMDSNEYDFKHLIGKKIIDIKFLNDEDCKDRYWSKKPLSMTFDDGSKLIPMADDEGNNGGSMCYKGTKWERGVSEVIYTI